MQIKIAQQGSKENATKTHVRQQTSSYTLKPNGMAGFFLNLQQTHGNRYVQRMLNDAVIQRKCAYGGTCDHCQSEGVYQEQEITQHILQRKGSGQPLEPSVQAFMESRFGEDFSSVRLHTDTHASQTTQQLNAIAYTVGRDIFLGSGQYRPQTHEGKRLLAHEFTHVVQQTPVIGAPQAKLMLSRAGDAAEREADLVAGRVVTGTGLAEISRRATALLQRKCEVATPKDCTDYEKWLDTFPTFPSRPPGTTGDVDIAGSMPKDLQDLITGKLGKGGGLPDCADVAMILRHYYLKAEGQSTKFLVGPTKEGAETFTLGKGATEKEVRACLRSAGTETFQETRSGFAVVNFYRKSVKKKKENITNLKELLSAGLKPGDLLVWKRRVAATGFQGHAQTVQAITLPKTDPKDPTKVIAPGTVVIVQGTMASGKGMGQLQQRLQTFTDLTGKYDGDADIKDTTEESFFGAGPWKS